MQNTVFGKPAIQKTETFFSDSPNLDSFGNLRVSMPTAVFDAQMTYDLSPLVYEQITSGTGATITYDATNRMAVMSFSNSPILSKSYMQSYDTLRYQPFRSQEIALTFNFIEHTTNVYKWVGYSDGQNGIEFGSDGINGFCVKLLSNTGNGDQIVYQNDWNFDRMDGTGISGLKLDVTKSNILITTFQALYVGRVICALSIDGKIYPLHVFNHANNIVYPYIQTANLPLTAGMIASGTVTSSMYFICSAVVSRSGDLEIAGYPFAIITPNIALTTANTHVLTIRPKKLFNGIVNRSQLKNLEIDIDNDGNNEIIWQLVIGQALSGTPAFIDVNTNYSTFEYCQGTGGVLSGSPAIVIHIGKLFSNATTKGQSSSEIDNKYPITLNAAGNNRDMGQLTIYARTTTSTSSITVTASWKEIR